MRRRRMSRRLPTVPGLARGAGLMLFVVLLVASPPSSTSQQTPAATPAAPPAGYAGPEACKGCHAEQYEKFSHTKMGRLMLHQPRNTTESLACEGCHGPGKAHVDAGGGKGKGGLITFAKNDPTP